MIFNEEGALVDAGVEGDDGWLVFLLQAEYDEKIELVKNGARNCLSKVEIVDVPYPQGVLVSIPHKYPRISPFHSSSSP